MKKTTPKFKVTLEQEQAPDAEERLLKIFEFLLEEPPAKKKRSKNEK